MSESLRPIDVHTHETRKNVREKKKTLSPALLYTVRDGCWLVSWLVGVLVVVCVGVGRPSQFPFRPITWQRPGMPCPAQWSLNLN